MGNPLRGTLWGAGHSAKSLLFRQRGDSERADLRHGQLFEICRFRLAHFIDQLWLIERNRIQELLSYACPEWVSRQPDTEPSRICTIFFNRGGCCKRSRVWDSLSYHRSPGDDRPVNGHSEDP